MITLLSGVIAFNSAAAVAVLPLVIKPELPEPVKIVPEKQQGFIAKKVLFFIEHYNYKKIVVNDSVSSVFLDLLVKTLDPDRSLFSGTDLKGFEKYRIHLDDDFRTGDLNAVFNIYEVYDERFRASVNASIAKGKPGARELLSQHEEQNSATVFQLIMDVFTKVIDPHTSYFNPAAAMAMEEQISRTVEGIGAAMLNEEGMVKITDVIAGGPAFRSGQVHAGDRIVAVAQDKEPFVSIAGWKVDKALKLIKGAKGSVVRLKLLRSGQPADGNTVVVELVRDKIILEQQSAKKSIQQVVQNGKTYKIGVIRIPAFYADEKDRAAGNANYKSTTRDVKLIIDTLKNIDKTDGLIIDLRGNGGGSLQEAIDLTGLFIDKGPVVQMRYNNQELAYGRDNQSGMAWEGPLAVMVNRTSASASEIFSGALQDYHRAIVLGSSTYGKGTAQKGLDLNTVIQPDTIKTLLTAAQQKIPGFVLQLGELSLTYAKFYRITGHTTQLQGVKPDITFPSIYADNEIGESSYPSALGADTIKALPFDQFSKKPYPVALLNKQHQERMKKSYQFDLLQLEIEHKKQLAASASSGKKNNQSADRSYLKKVNQIRTANGLKAIISAELTDTDIKNDFILEEGARVVVDLIDNSK